MPDNELEEQKENYKKMEEQLRLLIKTEMQLHRTQAELIKANRSLEEKVEARTAELLKSKKEIEEINKTLEERVEERTKALKESEKKLIQSSKLAAVGQLAAGLAHQINNPIGIILGFAQSIIKKVNEQDPLFLPLKTIEKEALRCSKFIKDLLIYSNYSKIEIEMIDINAAIENILTLIEDEIALKKINIKKKFGTGLSKISMQKNQLQQMIVNLINNAADAMPDGGTILIETMQKDHNAIIEIKDTGKGMSEETKKHLFEPFYTTKDVGKGIGLGLSLCYEIVKKYNGAIEIISEENKGTTIYIKFSK